MYESSLAIRRSTGLKALNFAGSVVERIGIRAFGLDRRAILKHAAEHAEFQFGDVLFEEGLDRLIRAVQSEAHLNTFGKLSFKRGIQRAADSRFLIERSLAERPSIRQSAIDSPLFVIGMPRTGTTVLHALLSQDPANRCPRCWECLLPHPASTPADYYANPRIDQVRSEFAQLFDLIPDFKKKHFMEADSPQECVGITALNFTSFQYLAQCHMPSYLEWFAHEADQVANMRWHKTFLQFLGSGGVRSTRWVLKSPVHLSRLRALFKVYPDARVVMTHRHPTKIVASVASLLTSVRSLYSDSEDSARTGAESLQVWGSYIDRFLSDRQSLDKEDQIVDVQFDDFVRDQLHVMELIYDRFGWKLDLQTRQRMQDFLVHEEKDKHGRHEYSLQQFGITESEVESYYKNYLDFLDDVESTVAD